MNRAMACLSVLALSLVIVATGVAQDTPKKKKGAGGKGAAANPMVAQVNQVKKALEAVGLTDEQQSKVKELAATLQEQSKTLKEEGLTPELMKKHADAVKAAKDAGKKGKDIQAAAKEGMSEGEVAVLKKLEEATTKFRQGVMALLTDEQKALLPEQAQKTWAAASKGKGKGKGKKKAD